MSDDALNRVRTICLALPETRETLSHGAPTWWAGKRTFANYTDNHHGDGRVALTGALATNPDHPVMRGYGPDFTGVFTHDAGSFGIKTKAAFRLIRGRAAE